MAIKNETELYLPVKAYFEGQGYEVKAEIQNCDLIAKLPGEATFTIVELKKTFNMQLLFQAIERLKLSDRVYVAIEYNPHKKLGSFYTWKDAVSLCQRLHIGLIGVQFYTSKKPAVDILCHPNSQVVPRKSPKRRQRIQTEFERRSGDYNIGGSSRTKLITSYRERALRCASQLSQHDNMSTRELRAHLNDPQVALLLQHNYYGWFERVSRGTYTLTAQGKQALIEYANIVEASN